MTRPAATVVICPVADPQATLRCIERLRPTLGPRDEIVLLVPDASSRPAPLRAVRSETAATGESLAALARRVAANAATPLVAELHADVTVTPHWLDRLAGAFDDPDVTAAGPRSNAAPSRQYVPAPAYGVGQRTSLRDWARAWAADAKAPTRVDSELPGFCRLVRRGVDPAQASGAIVNAVYVHHDAAAGCPDVTFGDDDSDGPLVSASLIVKDEEDVIADCLRAVSRFADEVVVYDTGSTDRTREIATELGATVVDGYWDEDFGAARNRSMEHCSGRWIICVDADEVLIGEPEHLRKQLLATPLEGLLVPIRNLSVGGTGSGSQHVGVRLFRRSAAIWDGRLHEQLMHRRLGRSLRYSTSTGLLIEHSGYLAERLIAKSKVTRNLAIAELAAVEMSGDDEEGTGRAAMNLARSVLTAGDKARAMVLFEHVWANRLTTRAQRQISAEAFVCAADMGDDEAAVRWLDRLECAGEYEPRLATARAQLAASRGRLAEAEELLASLPETFTDPDGVTFSATSTAALHARILVRLERAPEAAERLLGALRRGVSDLPLSEHMALLRDAKRPLEDLARALPPKLRMPFLAQCGQVEPADGHAMLAALWAVQPQVDVLAAAAGLAPALPVLHALDWSARLRSYGLGEECPLVKIAGDVRRSARDRTLAAAVAHETFADARAMPLLERALAAVPEADADVVLDELRVLAPAIAAAVEPAESLAS